MDPSQSSEALQNAAIAKLEHSLELAKHTIEVLVRIIADKLDLPLHDSGFREVLSRVLSRIDELSPSEVVTKTPDLSASVKPVNLQSQVANDALESTVRAPLFGPTFNTLPLVN